MKFLISISSRCNAIPIVVSKGVKLIADFGNDLADDNSIIVVGKRILLGQGGVVKRLKNIFQPLEQALQIVHDVQTRTVIVVSWIGRVLEAVCDVQIQFGLAVETGFGQKRGLEQKIVFFSEERSGTENSRCCEALWSNR